MRLISLPGLYDEALFLRFMKSALATQPTDLELNSDEIPSEQTERLGYCGVLKHLRGRCIFEIALRAYQLAPYVEPVLMRSGQWRPRTF